jgi:hypothetical protein
MPNRPSALGRKARNSLRNQGFAEDIWIGSSSGESGPIGHLAEAETELRAVLQLRRSILGDEHPHTLTTRNKLARVLRIQQRFDDARTEYEAVLASRRKVLGDDHPHTENTRQKLAAVNRHLAARMEPASLL